MDIPPDIPLIAHASNEKRCNKCLFSLRQLLNDRSLIGHYFILITTIIIMVTFVFGILIHVRSRHVEKTTMSSSSILSPPIIQKSLEFTSNKAQLCNQCDGKEYGVRRLCENDAKCFARDIAYWQCLPKDSCPPEWLCADVTFSENSSLSLEVLKDLLTSKAINISEPLDWSESIVDLMKLLGLDSREHSIMQLALKLGFTGDIKDGYKLHLWLYRQLLRVLAKNGGNIPTELKEL